MAVEDTVKLPFRVPPVNVPPLLVELMVYWAAGIETLEDEVGTPDIIGVTVVNPLLHQLLPLSAT